MKKILLALALIVTMAVIAQKNVVAPDAAKVAFAKTYPGAVKIKWEQEAGNYEVSFTLNGQKGSAIYDPKGGLVESEQEIKVTDLPAVVSAYMKNHYKGVTVKGAAKITKADGTVNYEAEIKGKDVLFDANGKFLKEVKD
ncbi:MAG: PepSY-like domain-containing protein [Sediminibacterium sp.]|nr:PepSY-like domain-containing protein [Sediminibacterium sp.]